MTFPEVHRAIAFVSRQAHERSSHDGRVESLSHTKWECKYHVVFPSRSSAARRYRATAGSSWRVASQASNTKGKPDREEGHLMPDHVHRMISIPPKYAVSQVIGYVKGKSAIHLSHYVTGNRRRNFVGQHFSGREDISSRPWGETKLDPGMHQEPGRRKIRGWSN